MDVTYHIGTLMKMLSENMEKNLNLELHKHGLTFSQIRTLMCLENMENGAASLKQLESRLHTSQPTIVGIACRLELKSMVESYSLPSDRRVKYLRITEKGRQTIEAAKIAVKKLEDHYMTGLTEEEMTQLHQLLRKVQANCK